MDVTNFRPVPYKGETFTSVNTTIIHIIVVLDTSSSEIHYVDIEPLERRYQEETLTLEQFTTLHNKYGLVPYKRV